MSGILLALNEVTLGLAQIARFYSLHTLLFFLFAIVFYCLVDGFNKNGKGKNIFLLLFSIILAALS
ncbi:MAG: hypothetical protein ACOC2J_04050, partial [bacterium]